jgi:3-isopropylmalate/(R)-2-methylmalate dehydratase small subunit
LRLQALVDADPGLELSIDLESLTVTAGGQRVTFTMPDSDRKSLVSGTWDTTAMLLSNKEAIRAAAARIPYLNAFAAARGAGRG